MTASSSPPFRQSPEVIAELSQALVRSQDFESSIGHGFWPSALPALAGQMNADSDLPTAVHSVDTQPYVLLLKLARLRPAPESTHQRQTFLGQREPR
jgi:hypothetical protein